MEKKEEQPAAMNAFELISLSKGLNLSNLFDMEQVCMFKTLSLLLPWNQYGDRLFFYYCFGKVGWFMKLYSVKGKW